MERRGELSSDISPEMEKKTFAQQWYVTQLQDESYHICNLTLVGNDMLQYFYLKTSLLFNIIILFNIGTILNLIY